MNISATRHTSLRWAIILSVLGLVSCGGSSGGGSEPPPPANTINLTIADTSVTEGDGAQVTMTFQLTLASAASSTQGVDYQTAAGSAQAGVDFTATSGRASFAAGATTTTVSVPILGDTLDEVDETFTLQLSNPDSGINLADTSAVGTVLDDDPEPGISVANASVSEGNNSVSLNFTVSLDAASGKTVTVNYQTQDGTAAAGSDYTATNGTLTINPGQLSGVVSVPVLGDTVEEPDETLTLTLSAPVNAGLLDASATGTIVNDDSAGGPLPGLSQRPTNVTCVAPDRPSGIANVELEDSFPTAPAFSAPTKSLQVPGDGSRWFVLEKGGRVRVFAVSNPAGASTYLDFSGQVNTSSEGGLLGMAFDPNFPATPEVYVSYTANAGPTGMESRVSRVILDNVTTPVNVTEQILIRVTQDFTNHNGGDIAFGADGYLYFGLGDGGSGGDPNDRAQDTTRLLGSFLRLDVRGVAWPSPAYQIPVSNPFAGNALCGPAGNANSCPEIYAWGFRNPWRWSFDTPTGTLWAGDVGQNAWEEIDRVQRGGNYGWRCLEGTHDYNTTGCPVDGFVAPVYEYDRAAGQSISGGFVYRGTEITELLGRYVFGDFSSGRIWALTGDGQGGFTADLLIDTSYNLSSFAMDASGELYVADYANGRIRKLINAVGQGSDPVAELLSDTGCRDPADITKPYAGLVNYDMNASFWSDGADKTRQMGIPDGTTVTIGADNDWTYPAGSILVKNFLLGGKLIETRHMIRHPDGVWAGYTYEWNDAQTEAVRVRGGKVIVVNGQDWIIPSESECMQCHTAAAGFALGPETAQLNGDFAYPETGITANQLFTLESIGYFSQPLADTPANLPALADPEDVSADINDRGRAYMHTNCAQCHRPGGPTPTDMDWRYTTALADTNACNVVPSHGFVGLPGGLLIDTGNSGNSIVVRRINRRDAMGMPPLASNLVDSVGVVLISQWIDQLAGCQ